MVIHESAEDYLESILILQERRGHVRSIDIVNELGYSKPSVSVAMKKLRESGYISMAPDGSITLNETGLEVAGLILCPPQDPDETLHPDGCLPGDSCGGRLQGRTRCERGDVLHDPAICGVLRSLIPLLTDISQEDLSFLKEGLYKRQNF